MSSSLDSSRRVASRRITSACCSDQSRMSSSYRLEPLMPPLPRTTVWPHLPPITLFDYTTLHQPTLVDRRPDEGREQRVRLERPRLELGVELDADEPGVV